MCSMTMSAQTDCQSDSDLPDFSSSKYQVFTNGFWSNWFLSANISGKSFYSDEENDITPKVSGSPFSSFRTNIGISVSVGKWFTPGIGLRTKVTGIWGKNVLSDDAATNAIKYWNIQEQLLFNLNNLIKGYNEKRLWNIIPYMGVGLLRNCSDNEFAHGASVGVINIWKLNRRFDLNVDLGFYISDDDIDGAARTNTDEYAISLSSADRAYYAEIGITFHLGRKTWKKASYYHTALEQLNQAKNLNSSLQNQLQESERLRKEASAKQDSVVTKTIVVEKHIIPSISIFFPLGKSSIASRKELQNVRELIDYATEYHAKVIVRGYADSRTGTQEYNKELSLMRANIVADELVSMGFSRESIEIVGEGGVDKWKPDSYNRRVVVSVEE